METIIQNIYFIVLVYTRDILLSLRTCKTATQSETMQEQRPLTIITNATLLRKNHY